MNIEHLWIGMQYICYNRNIQNIHNKLFEHLSEKLEMNIPSFDFHEVLDSVTLNFGKDISF